MTGYAGNECPQRFILNADGAKTEAELEGLLKHETCRLQTSLRRKDGKLIKVEVSSALVKSADPKIIVFIQEVMERSK
jgi:hypothetical protein